MARNDGQFKKGNKGGPGRPLGWSSRSFLIDALRKIDATDPDRRTKMERWAEEMTGTTDPEQRIAILKFIDGPSPPVAKPTDVADEEARAKGGIVIPAVDDRYSRSEGGHEAP